MQSISVRDRAVHLDDAGVLVIADTHLGRDEASGVTFPLGEREDLTDRLTALIAHFSPSAVVFAGDVVHTFDGVSSASEAALRALVDACEAGGSESVLLAGNHDTALRELWDGDLREEFLVEGVEGELDDASETTFAGVSAATPTPRNPRRTVVCHGHAAPATEADRYVIGHDHPVIEIEGVRHPCVLYGEGTYRGGDVVVLPAFNRLAPGVVVNDLGADAFDSPLVRRLDRFRPYVWDADSQETLAFPPLGEFREHL